MKGIYINLDERLDRKEHIEKLKSHYSFFQNLKRFKAYKNNSNPLVGRGVSHIKAFEMMLNTNGDYFLIIEDDLMILNHQNFLKFQDDFKKIINKNWDIIILTPYGVRDKSFNDYKDLNFSRITDNKISTGYIIKKDFVQVLIDIFRYGIANLIRGEDPKIYAHDQIWKTIQKDNLFLYYNNIFAGQLPGYSSVKNSDTDYNQKFLTQS